MCYQPLVSCSSLGAKPLVFAAVLVPRRHPFFSFKEKEEEVEKKKEETLNQTEAQRETLKGRDS